MTADGHTQAARICSQERVRCRCLGLLGVDIEEVAQVMDKAIDVHDRVMRGLLSQYFGFEVTTEGDAFQFVFHHAADAVAYAIAAQQALLTAKWPPELEQHFRTRTRYVLEACSSEDAQLGNNASPLGESRDSFTEKTQHPHTHSHIQARASQFLPRTSRCLGHCSQGKRGGVTPGLGYSLLWSGSQNDRRFREDRAVPDPRHQQPGRVPRSGLPRSPRYYVRH